MDKKERITEGFNPYKHVHTTNAALHVYTLNESMQYLLKSYINRLVLSKDELSKMELTEIKIGTRGGDLIWSK